MGVGQAHNRQPWKQLQELQFSYLNLINATVRHFVRSQVYKYLIERSITPLVWAGHFVTVISGVFDVGQLPLATNACSRTRFGDV